MSTVIGSQFDLLYCEGVQKFLNQNCQNLSKSLTIDGNLGPASSAALSLYQGQQGLTQSGVYDAATQALAEPTILSQYIQTADIQAAAQQLGVNVPSVMAVCMTETSGSGFFNDKTCAILFERHIFYAQLQKAGVSSAQLAAYVSQFPNIVNPTPGGYSGGPAEWTRYNAAALINVAAAQSSISMGLFQIMGMNSSYCGYSSVGSYFLAMETTEKAQLSAFITFIQKYMNGALLTALRNQDWASLAKGYNGPAQVATYSSKLSSNYTLFSNMS
jgi:peptidoglycan hydrolase-like protein with peptidoglycan-binding domain